jgi:hypothetical protein
MAFNSDVWDRVSEALGGHDVHPDESDLIQKAYSAEPEDIAKWPAEAQAALARAEKSEATSWDDPADVPDSIATHR